MQPDRSNPAAKSLWALSGLGGELFGAIAGMGLLGWLIDRYIVGSGHTWLFVCLVIGIIGGSYNFIRQALALNKKAAAEYRRAAQSRPKADVPPPPREPHRPSAPGGGWFESTSTNDDHDLPDPSDRP